MADEADYRRRILEKAAEKFFSLGFARVTMDELAAELGMSKKTLYKYFPAKADLIQAMVMDFIQGIVAEQDRILHDESLDFETRISEMMKLLAGIVGRISPLFLRDMQRSAPQACKMIEDTRQHRIQTVFGSMLAEGQRSGYIRKDIHLPFVVAFIATAIRETLNPGVLSQFPLSLVEAFETIRTILMGGVLTNLGREKFLKETSFLGWQEASAASSGVTG